MLKAMPGMRGASLVLNELGLTPLWRIREANAPEAAELNKNSYLL